MNERAIFELHGDQMRVILNLLRLDKDMEDTILNLPTQEVHVPDDFDPEEEMIEGEIEQELLNQ